MLPGLMGMLLPFMLSKFNMDPATARTVLVTLIVDATGVLIYSSIAKSILDLPQLFKNAIEYH